MRIGELDEVGADKRSGLVVAIVEELLPLAHHAEIAVVNDGDVDLDLLLDNGGEFGSGHLEATVPNDDPDFFVGAGEFGADRGGERKSHGGKAARGGER